MCPSHLYFYIAPYVVVVVVVVIHVYIMVKYILLGAWNIWDFDMLLSLRYAWSFSIIKQLPTHWLSLVWLAFIGSCHSYLLVCVMPTPLLCEYHHRLPIIVPACVYAVCAHTHAHAHTQYQLKKPYQISDC